MNNYRDIFEALLAGKKLKSSDWGDGEYIKMNDNGMLIDENGDELFMESFPLQYMTIVDGE
ncbi:hypothetical protein [uncultured Arcobacter sp.]|uniref:hypothetical protein n=1 Tax=uncultured Arcobacter sp. TaxID=165434 RepID=UPI002627A507|nr:hypothetical protein [uncultured Arcobacter sp.]